MAGPSPPSLIRRWQYISSKGGIENNMKLNSIPLPTPKPTQNLIQVIAAAINPVDHKPAEGALVGKLLIPKIATPGLDFAGRIVTPAKNSSFKPGQLVFGVSNSFPFAGGALSEYILTSNDTIAAVPEGVDPMDAAIVGVAGLTAIQSVAPHIKEGDKIFINGGSGGCGVFGIQIAKALGCHVTVTCSTANVELCKSLGADEVVDYKKGDVVGELVAGGHKFDHVVDNVGSIELYKKCHEFMHPKAVYAMVGHPSGMFTLEMLSVRILPGFLGGGKRTYQSFMAKPNVKQLDQIGQWMKEGKVKAVIDSKFPFEQAPDAFRKLKTGRAKGKILVDVASETYKISE
jgi:NADPH:quinone reductase-like Zn-dependent oxidoreductase